MVIVVDVLNEAPCLLWQRKACFSISQGLEAHMPVFLSGFPWIITTQFPCQIHTFHMHHTSHITHTSHLITSLSITRHITSHITLYHIILHHTSHYIPANITLHQITSDTHISHPISHSITDHNRCHITYKHITLPHTHTLKC